jgi:hypothetical protein
MLDSDYVDIFNIMYAVFLEFAVLPASEDDHYMTDYLKLGGCVDEGSFFCVLVHVSVYHSHPAECLNLDMVQDQVCSCFIP